MVKPGYKKLEVVSATYKDAEETVLIKPASKRYEYVPAVYKKVSKTIQVEQPFNKITTQTASFAASSESVIVQPAYAHYEWKTSQAGCKSQDPRDCMVLCYVSHPRDTLTVPTETVKSDANFTKEQTGGKTITYTAEEVVTPASVKEIEIPAEYKTIKTRVLVTDETVKEVSIPAEYRTEKVRELVKKGGMTVWTEIDCNLTDANVLPILYDLGSARLTAESRRIIDQKLLKLMTEKPLIRVEINSHTDSRGTSESNMALSEARAQSVVDYLVSKGIKRSRLVARGYGETS
ncbi:MAG: OmpA family protein [Lewinellaceae bacterium]|nr:OmpA family protein [Lewinellaceae bacterium]